MKDTLQLLVIGSQPEQAEEINSLLRNSGINVHVNWADSRSQALDSLRDSSPDLILANPGAFDCVPAPELFSLARQHEIEVALRVSPRNAETLTLALQESQFTAINSENEEQLVTFVRKLMHERLLERQLQMSRSRFAELDLRYRSLLESSSHAAAYLHEGLHVFANRAYIEMLGAHDMASIAATSLVEIAHSPTTDLKKLLRDMGSGHMPDAPVPAVIQAQDGPIDVALTFTHARIDGEDCLQMVVLGPAGRDGLELVEEHAHLPNTTPRTASSSGVQKDNELQTEVNPAPDSVSETKHWLERIRHALDTNSLLSVQQTIVNLDGESEGLFESRTYLGEEGEHVPIESFLVHAEQLDLGASIDRHVIPGLLGSIAGSGDRHIINISANSLLDFSFPGWLGRQMDERGVRSEQLILQINADSVAANTRAFARLTEELGGHGCGFSLSNFVARQDQEDALKTLDIGWVKLRSGLATGIASNPENQAIVRQVSQAAEEAGAAVITDDVRDAADLAVLWQCGVKLVSGEFLNETPQVVGQ